MNSTKFFFLKEVESTNRVVREWLSEERITHGCCIFTDYQSAGRGQGTNRWESERGENLLFSLLVDAQKFPLHKQFLLSELMAVSMCKTLRQYLPNVELKWPNDIYVGDKKLGGVLIETIIGAETMKYAIIGVGINVNQTKFVGDAPNPISMTQILSKTIDIRSLLLEIVSQMVADCDEFELKDAEQLQQQYHSMLYRREGFHKFCDQDGTFEASILKVEDNGRLYLQLNDYKHDDNCDNKHDNQCDSKCDNKCSQNNKCNRVRTYWFKEVRFVI